MAVEALYAGFLKLFLADLRDREVGFYVSSWKSKVETTVSYTPSTRCAAAIRGHSFRPDATTLYTSFSM
jgi:hypothetical protein